MLDRMVVAIETDNLLIKTKLDVIVVNLKVDDLEQKATDVIIGKWEWTPETMDKYGDKIEQFLLDPTLYKDILGSVRWPMAQEFPEELGGDWHTADEAIKRCRLAVYRRCKMDWAMKRSRETGGKYVKINRQVS